MRAAERPDEVGRELTSWCERLVGEGSVDAVAVETVAAAASAPVVSARAGRQWRGGPPISGRSRFDLASLTKPWTASLALRLDRSGVLALTTRVGDLWPAADERLASIQLEDLLRHRAGLVRWRPLYALCDGEEEVLERLLAGEWLVEEPGEVYSDLDYLLWGFAAERATGSTFGDLVADLLEELGICEVDATGSEMARRHGIECRLTTEREVALAAEADLGVESMASPPRGIVQDGNARFFGRAMAHAGLFATSSAVARLVREWLAPESVLSEPAVERALGGGGRFALGWFRRAEIAPGRGEPGTSVGHDGFTGGTIWLDRDVGAGVVMLAHRSSLGVDLRPVREELVARAGLF